MYRRPLECRLCRCPVADGGVPLSRLDREKLSEWWLLHLDTQFEHEGEENEWICQFCAWDARFKHENSEDGEKRSSCDWWSDQEDPFYKFFCDELIQPCSVRISPLSKNLCDKHSKSGGSKIEDQVDNLQIDRRCNKTKCIYCDKMFLSKRFMVQHLKIFHKNLKFVQCSKCRQYFRTKDEKRAHISKITTKPEFTTVFSAALFSTAWKFATCDRSTAKWPYSANNCKCAAFFKTLKEKEEHVAQKHATLTAECIYCKKRFYPFALVKHVEQIHKKVEVRCDFNNKCTTYFYSEEERDKQDWHKRRNHVSLLR